MFSRIAVARSGGLLLLVLAMGSGPLASGAESDASMSSLRSIGVEIKAAYDRSLDGESTPLDAIERFDRILVKNDANAESSPSAHQKRAAIGHLLDALRIQANKPVTTKRAPVSRASLDMETVLRNHGDRCPTALGVSAQLPVRLTLAQSASAWFRFEPKKAGPVRFSTQSSGADPAIEIYRSCVATAAAANDDDFGLDASAALDTERAPLFVRLTNTGRGGAIVLTVAEDLGTITGKLSDAKTGAPLAGATAQIFNSFEGYEGSVNTDANGAYSMYVSVGSHYVRGSEAHHVSLLYPNAVCQFQNYSFNLDLCDVAHALAVTVAGGATASGIDIALGQGQRLSGRIKDTLGHDLSGGLHLYRASDNYPITQASTDEFGRFSFNYLPVGNYKLSAQSDAYGSQMFDHVTCSGPFFVQCDLAQAAAIALSNGDITGIDFELPPLSVIHGTLSGSAFDPGYCCNQVTVYDSSGSQVQYVYAFQGTYTTSPLANGTYYVVARNPGSFSQLYDGMQCPDIDCQSVFASGTPIQIAHTGTSVEADFVLSPLPSITGRVTDLQSGLPLANVTVQISPNPPATFTWTTQGVTDTNGNYTIADAPAGSYYLWAQSLDHIDRVYPTIDCELTTTSLPTTCDVTGAVRVTIASGQAIPAFDFALRPASIISGMETVDAGVPTHLPAFTAISIYDASGTPLAAVNPDATGHYIVGDLPRGTYYALAGNGFGDDYVNQIWNAMNCSVCVPTTGTAIAVGDSAIVTGIDFRLIDRNAIVGRVVDKDGMPATGLIIDLFSAANSTIVESATTDADGFFLVDGTIGNSYFVATDAEGAYFDQIYDGISCPLGPAFFGLCSFTGATPIALTAGTSQPHIANFVLKSTDPLFKNGFDTPP